MKNFMFACIAIAALAVAFYFVSGGAMAQAGAAPQSQVVRAASNGRWTVVNGTPEYAMNIMLLDTATGDTWLKCGDKDGVTYWCRILRTNTPTGNTDQPATEGK